MVGLSQEPKEENRNTPFTYGQPEKVNSNSWRFRNSVQLGIFLLTLGIGIQFFIYVLQASSAGAIEVSRPPGVEGFLPIGALLGWKLFLTTGVWDDVHPAAMVILGFAGLISLFLRKSFCGWFCPVGTLSEWLWKLGKKLFRKNYQVPKWLDFPLRSMKYLILGFFIWSILSMGRSAILDFLHSPYYKISDVKMLFFFTRMSTTSAIVLFVLLTSSLMVRNSWCRYLCPYGALMGLFSFISPTRILRNSKTCIQCKSCAEVCPYHLPVNRKEHIRSSECNGCMDCVSVCPVENTLELKRNGSTGRFGLL
ncbi:hypothetical protein LCGC14_2127590 [marine sediment metagenome]|uniref:4Fe-4S ferredoxin-type domain-containing protein n=1 Tax=marine sediment metagenome TaxID=412755 RepID=A0A0F9E2C1_9ZZZZ